MCNSDSTLLTSTDQCFFKECPKPVCECEPGWGDVGCNEPIRLLEMGKTFESKGLEVRNTQRTQHKSQHAQQEQYGRSDQPPKSPNLYLNTRPLSSTITRECR